jgi:hypothetical protein
MEFPSDESFRCATAGRRCHGGDPVTAARRSRGQHGEGPSHGPSQTPAQKAIGDIAPKLVELNDDVLFGDIWERARRLSKRDRSLITVASAHLAATATEQLSLPPPVRDRERFGTAGAGRGAHAPRVLRRLAERHEPRSPSSRRSLAESKDA